ncbi:MAG TPA: hypothetical protein VFG58_07475 [Solirubrobacterales bacterium]|nr:hypothetical protein [Solirubrobacterales bacterium]
MVASLAGPLDWHPFDEDWLWNGLVYAATAQGLVRIEPQAFSEELGSARSVLVRSIAFVIHAVDERSQAAVEAALDALDDSALAAEASYIYSRYVVMDARIPRETRKLLFADLEDAVAKLELPARRVEGRGRLETFCVGQFVERQLLRRALHNAGKTRGG